MGKTGNWERNKIIFDNRLIKNGTYENKEINQNRRNIFSCLQETVTGILHSWVFLENKMKFVERGKLKDHNAFQFGN